MSRAQQLARTALLFQSDLGTDDTELVLHALGAPKIVLTGGDAATQTRAGQSALLTAALLIARSGQRVYVHALDVPLIGYQPPFSGRTLYEAIHNIRGELIDGNGIEIGFPMGSDLAFVFGGESSTAPLQAKRTITVGWTAWSGEINAWPRRSRFAERDWPLGALVAAVLVAAEAIKLSGAALCRILGHHGHFAELFGLSGGSRIRLAPDDTPKTSNLGLFDMISAGAVSNAVLYTLLRLPDVVGEARVFDRDRSDQSNRNRNMLLIASLEHLTKVALFERFGRGLRIDPVARHFEADDLQTLSDQVVVGVDNVPTRWLLAQRQSLWMGVGATSHFNAMSSVHYPYTACAACLHPHDEDMPGDTPTISFVSFLAGLFVAADLLIEASGSRAFLAARQRYVTPLQTAGAIYGPVAPNPDCPAGCPVSQIMRRSA
jgi:hypothetical protein